MLTVSTIVTILVFALPVIGALLGFKRGTRKSILRLVTVGIAIALTILFTPTIAKMILDMPTSTFGAAGPLASSDGTIQGFFINTLTSNETLASLLSASPSLLGIIEAIPLVLLSEILFIVIFFVAKFLMWFVFAIISLIFFRAKRNPETGKKKKCSFLSRIFGTGVGFVQGAACMAMLMVPVIGILSFTNSTTDILKDDAFSDVQGIQTVVQLEDKYLSEINNSAGMKFVQTVKIDKIAMKIFNNMSKVTLGEGASAKEVYLLQDLKDNILPSVVPLMKLSKMDMSNLGGSSTEELKQLITTIGSSEMASQVLSDIVSDAAEKLKTEEGFMGISLSGIATGENGEEQDEVSKVVDEIITSLSEASAETVAKDMTVFVDVLDLVSTYKEENPVAEDEPAKTEFEIIAELAKEPEYNQKLIDIVKTEGTTFADKNLDELLLQYLNSQQPQQ